MYFILLFSYGTKDVFSDICSWISGDILHNADIICITGTLAAKLKIHAKLSAQLAFRTQVLFDTDRLLQKAKSRNRDFECHLYTAGIVY